MSWRNFAKPQKFFRTSQSERGVGWSFFGGPLFWIYTKTLNQSWMFMPFRLAICWYEWRGSWYCYINIRAMIQIKTCRLNHPSSHFAGRETGDEVSPFGCLSLVAVLGFRVWVAWLEWPDWLQDENLLWFNATVDGRNPAPPGMYKPRK